MRRCPLAHQRAARDVAAVAVDDQEAAKALAVERVEQVAQNGEEGLEPERRAARVGRERRGQPVRQHRQHEHAQRLRGLGRDALGQDVVGLEREVAVLLRRAERQDDPVVAREVLLQVHPVELVDMHRRPPKIRKDDCYTQPRAAA